MNKQEYESPRERMEKRRKRSQRYLILAVVLMLVGLTILLPPVRTRIAYRLDDLKIRLTYWLNPPDEAVFVPEEQDQLATMVAATLAAYAPTATIEATPTATLQPNETPLPTQTPTIAPTPLPESVDLPGVTYVDQHNRWNYCGPANLTMALKFWGWGGSRDDIARAIKPGENDPELSFIDRGKSDKNVMPYEMVNFVTDDTDYNIVTRYGGDMDLLKELIANGYPVLIEKGYYERDYTGKTAWMGHYLFVTGYDDAEGIFIVQDAYLETGEDGTGANLRVPYADFQDGWRGFNYLFMVIYPAAQEQEVYTLLGPWADDAWANTHALDIANEEIGTQTGINEFFAWFNKGTSHVELFEYADAAFAYDYAFVLYATIGEPNEAETVETQRPYRIMWYQTGPYWAYYYSGRYQDVINLANTTLYDTISEPTLEESIYWRGMAELAIGETGNAVDDFRQTVYLNSSFIPGIEMLQQLGVEP
ncbi:C39 family peptidase [bacterium]|nr:C39 family peptidase [bacterium]MCB2178997.1 C39 family peptidase [bacterium]